MAAALGLTKVGPIFQTSLREPCSHHTSAEWRCPNSSAREQMLASPLKIYSQSWRSHPWPSDMPRPAFCNLTLDATAPRYKTGSSESSPSTRPASSGLFQIYTFRTSNFGTSSPSPSGRGLGRGNQKIKFEVQRLHLISKLGFLRGGKYLQLAFARFLPTNFRHSAA
jgi:hypothetical protein